MRSLWATGLREEVCGGKVVYAEKVGACGERRSKPRVTSENRFWAFANGNINGIAKRRIAFMSHSDYWRGNKRWATPPSSPGGLLQNSSRLLPPSLECGLSGKSSSYSVKLFSLIFNLRNVWRFWSSRFIFRALIFYYHFLSKVNLWSAYGSETFSW